MFKVGDKVTVAYKPDRNTRYKYGWFESPMDEAIGKVSTVIRVEPITDPERIYLECEEIHNHPSNTWWYPIFTVRPIKAKPDQVPKQPFILNGIEIQLPEAIIKCLKNRS